MTQIGNKKGQFPSILSDFFNADNFFATKWFDKEFDQTLPAVNIKENGNEFNIEFAAPGFSKTDFTVNIEDDLLTVSAEKNVEKNEEQDKFTRKEFSYNAFARSFTLPKTANADKIDARYLDGILKLSIPKKEEAKKDARKEIKVD
jgi:HSP20 family protein